MKMIRKLIATIAAFCMVVSVFPPLQTDAAATDDAVGAETVETQETDVQSTDKIDSANLYIRIHGADRYDPSGNAYYNVPAIVGAELSIGPSTGPEGNLKSNGQLSYQWQIWDSDSQAYVDIDAQTGESYTTAVTEQLLRVSDAVRCVVTSVADSASLVRYIYYSFTETVVLCDNAGGIVPALRAQMTQRQRYSAAACPTNLAPDSNALQLLAHTGNPKEGDYLANLTRRYAVSTTQTEINGLPYTVFTVEAVYLTTAEQEKMVDAAVAKILPQLDTADSYSAIYSIFNYIRTNVVYDHAHFDDLMDHSGYMTKQTAYGALIDGAAVCEGISQTFYRLCLEVGVDARVITGSAVVGPHAWNIADVDSNGLYYLFDATLGVAYVGRRDAYDVDPVYWPDSVFTTDIFNTQYPISEDHYRYGDIAYTVEGTTLTIHENVPDFYGDANVTTFWWSGFSKDTIETIIIDEGVTKIGSGAFYEFSALKQVQLPKSLQRIGNEVFYDCRVLETVNFPDALVSIGDSAFRNCVSMACDVTIPDSVEFIGAHAFFYCTNLHRITINPSSRLKYVGEGAFGYTLISGIYLPDGIREVPARLFQCCSSLESVQMSDKVSAIGEGAFERCKLRSFTFPAGVTRIEDRTFYACESLEEINLPDTITYIGSYAFYYCSQLTNLSLPDNLTYLGDHAFLYCPKISGEMVIPATLTYIGDGAFATATITLFSVTEENPAYCAVDGVLFNKEKTELLAFPKNYFSGGEGTYTVPDGTLRIGYMAFNRQFQLQQINLPDGLSEIGALAFGDCSKLTALTIPDSVVSIGANAFAYCHNLQTITLPAYLSRLEENVFYACSDLTEITIPQGMTTICRYAFDGCSSLSTLHLPDSLEKVESRAFYQCTALTTVNYAGATSQWANLVIEDGNEYLTGATVNFGKEDTVQPGSNVTVTFDGNGAAISAESITVVAGNQYGELPVPAREGYTFTGWVIAPEHGALVTEDALVAFEENHTLYALWEPVTACGSFGNGFTWILYTDGTLVICGVGDLPASDIPWYHQQNIQSVKVTGSITGICDNAFDNKETITRVELPEGLTAIGKQAFWCCSALSELQLPDSVLRIEEGAFNACVSLEEITLPENLQYIGDYAFRSTGLKQVQFPEGLQEIRPLAFTYCDNLKEVILPASLKNLYNSAFRECAGLQTVTLLGAPEFIGHAAFRDCTALQTVNLSDGLLQISADMFYGCTGLQNIALPNSVTIIGNYAFCNASNLKTIDMSGVHTVGASAFAGCTALETVEYSTALKRIGAGAFANCVSLPQAVVSHSTSQIGYSAFGGCVSLTNVTLTGSCIGGERAFADCTALRSVQFTSVTTMIPAQIFAGCTALETLQLSSTVETVEAGAFADCTSLATVYWPGTLAEWEAVEIRENNEALLNARAICTDTDETVVTVTLDSAGGAVESAQINVLYGATYGTLPIPEKENAMFLGWYTASTGGSQVLAETQVLKLEAHTLYARWTALSVSGQCGDDLYWSLYEDGQLHITGTGQMWELTTYPWDAVKASITVVYAHEGVENIAAAAFRDCDGIESIRFAETVRSIGANGFYDCDNLTTLTIPETVTEIGDKAFAGCSILREVSVSTTGTYMFHGCSSLKTAQITGGADTVAAYSFFECRSLEQVTIGEGVTSIGNSAFQECDDIQNVTLPNSLLHIGNYTFAGINDWTAPALPEGLQTIGTYCFGGSWVEEISIPDSVVSMGDEAFRNCGYLKRVQIGEGITELPEAAFQSCYSLQTVQLPSSLQVIGKNVFYGCESLAEITIPDGVTTICPGAFSNCGFTSIEIPGNVISVSGFYGCTKLETVILHEGVTTIDAFAFEYCTALKSITLPASVQTIHVRIFADCPNLQEIIFLGDAPVFNTEHSWWWGDNAFSGVTATVYYPQDNATWTEDQLLDHGGTITWKPWKTLGSIPACEHDLQPVENVITCTENYTLYRCSCGYSYVENSAEVPGHSYEAVVTAPTCTAEGYTTYTCTACGDSYIADPVETIDHSWSSWKVTVAPTCTEPGEESCSCDCGVTQTREIPACHNYENGKCTGCGEFENEDAALRWAMDLSSDGKVTAFDAQILAEAIAGQRMLTDEAWAAIGKLLPADIVDYILGKYNAAA